jgi:hypothetical protein
MTFLISSICAAIAVLTFFLAENYFGIRPAVGVALFVLFSVQMELALRVKKLESTLGMDSDSN